MGRRDQILKINIRVRIKPYEKNSCAPSSLKKINTPALHWSKIIHAKETTLENSPPHNTCHKICYFLALLSLGLFRASHLFLASGFIPLSFHIAYYVAYVMNSPGYFPLSA